MPAIASPPVMVHPRLILLCGRCEAALGVGAQNPTGATRVYERAGMCVERQYDVFEKGL